jgi:hypothetical protein
MLTLFNEYSDPLYACLGVVAGLWLSILYERICPENKTGAIALFIVSLGGLYYFAGGAASIVFVLTAGVRAVLSDGRKLIGGSIFVIGFLTIFLFGFYLSPLIPKEAFFTMIGPEKAPKLSLELIVEICLYLFFPVLAAAAGLRKVRSRHKAGEKFASKNTRAMLQVAALAAVCFLTAFYSFDGKAKQKSRTIYLDRQEKWTEVVEHIRQLPIEDYSLFYNHFLNKALYFSGRLGDEMFLFPQQTESFLLNAKVAEGLREIAGCHTFLRLGEVNLAEKKAHEIMESTGEHPQILKLLALINIVKDQPETARMYLKALRKKLIYGSQAKNLLAKLDAPLQNTNPEVEYLRSVMLKTDSHLPDNKVTMLLLELLSDNPSNRMAFEYLMGYYLITGKLEEFANNISRLKDLNFIRIPAHYAEGILTHQSITGKKINMHGLSIAPEIVEKFKVFEKDHDSYKDKQTAAKALIARFGHCYYYYYTFYGME